MNCSRRREDLTRIFKESLEFKERIDYNRNVKKKAPTPKVDAPSRLLKCPYGHCLPCGSDRVGILFTLISLIEKGDNRYNQAAKGRQQSQYPYED